VVGSGTGATDEAGVLVAESTGVVTDSEVVSDGTAVSETGGSTGVVLDGVAVVDGVVIGGGAAVVLRVVVVGIGAGVNEGVDDVTGGVDDGVSTGVAEVSAGVEDASAVVSFAENARKKANQQTQHTSKKVKVRKNAPCRLYT